MIGGKEVSGVGQGLCFATTWSPPSIAFLYFIRDDEVVASLRYFLYTVILIHMLRSLSFLLIASLALYWYATVGIVCSAPLSYSIVAPIDDRFGLTEREAIDAAKAAEATWEQAIGRELLFVASTSNRADVEIRFVFDERQERALAEESLRESLENKQANSSNVQASYDELVASYSAANRDYTNQVAAYEARLAAHNDTVADYNANGGAPSDVYAVLAEAEAALSAEARALDREAERLQKLARDINELGEQGNQIIRQYNAGVTAYNSEFGEPDEFTQGDYQAGQISIYTFANRDELIKVLAHEFGHALSLPHVEGGDSIMYYLLEDQPTPLALSNADSEALVATCGETGRIGTQVRTLINRYLF